MGTAGTGRGGRPEGVVAPVSGKTESGTGLYRAEIVANADGSIEWESGPESQHNAEKIAAGAGINLNWRDYHTHVVPIEAGQT